MKRWCNSIPQYNLFTSCFEDINIYRHGRSMVWSNPFEIKTNISRPISNQLKKRIFEELNKMVEIKRRRVIGLEHGIGFSSKHTPLAHCHRDLLLLTSQKQGFQSFNISSSRH